MEKKSYWINLTLVFVALIVSLVIVEIGLRIIIFSNISFPNSTPL
jgi:hypothetical protein